MESGLVAALLDILKPYAVVYKRNRWWQGYSYQVTFNGEVAHETSDHSIAELLAERLNGAYSLGYITRMADEKDML